MLTLDRLSQKLKTNLWVHGRLVTLSASRRIGARITITNTGWELYVQLRKQAWEPTREQIRQALVAINLVQIEDGLIDLLQHA